MADYPPFMNAYGNIPRILNKIKEAKTPDRFSQDYLETVLGFSGGSSRSFIPLAKRIGLLNPDGSPSDLYSRFRNPAQSEQAMAQMIRKGYPELYKRNEYADRLDRPKLQGLLMQVTGLDKTSPTLRALIGTFDALKNFANFELLDATTPATTPESDTVAPAEDHKGGGTLPRGKRSTSDTLRFSHNIFINLPDSTDPEVFSAIFRALRENLLT